MWKKLAVGLISVAAGAAVGYTVQRFTKVAEKYAIDFAVDYDISDIEGGSDEIFSMNGFKQVSARRIRFFAFGYHFVDGKGIFILRGNKILEVTKTGMSILDRVALTEKDNETDLLEDPETVS